MFLVYGGEKELVVMGYTMLVSKLTKTIQSRNQDTYL
jgi:hypothetical protein